MDRRQFLQVSSAAFSGLALSGCGWTLASINTTATAQDSADELYLYTWAGYTDDDLLARFREETGIRVIADVFDSNEAMLARLQASGGGAYSIIYPSDYMVQKMAALGLLIELDKSQVVGLDQLFERFQNPIYDPGNRYSVPLSWGTTGLIYNKAKLGEIPQDWDYLWEHQGELSKRMTLLNDVREVMGATLRSLGYSYNSTNPDEIEAAYDKLRVLKPAIASFTSDAWRNQILSGDLLVAMCYSSDANEAMPENEDLEYVLPLSGSSLFTDTLVIPRTAPNIAGAYAWINFMLQPDIAAQICERLSFATPIRSAFELLPPEIQDNVSLFPPDPGLGLCEGIAPVGDSISELYERYWTRLTSG
ncbi:spermidine/putrescine ABC transporter substrate-binding protein [Lusitaniella coriacea LEGE 07157]|uniref:Spermidine/putrescine ABC transporter substrate-binding protein n=1 Tax=Lusitaniella coriacea LEGE 07157 TaxID=945747 RepID=A0A8J7IT58_9CYAN|nr:spermidine/putrescine ABC transporter substrate-binding protein [Lusitaniella coriacea]MBE9116627.1 spermidine/putrescine ABC transporter substrate-binding protein [Lusitaniella coriacea LEGE 07157]